MVRDILESGKWEVVIRHTYAHTESGKNFATRKALSKAEMAERKCQPLDAFVDEEELLICIDVGAEDHPLCLFHECLEILFADWKDDYFFADRWGIAESDDPFDFMEKATWDCLSEEQKETIAAFLPQRK